MKEIIMFTSSTCPHCTTAKNILKQKGYAFVERNVQIDPAARQQMTTLGVMGVPSFLIGNEVMTGLDIDKLEKLLDYVVAECPSCSRKARIPKDKGLVKITCKNCNESYNYRT